MPGEADKPGAFAVETIFLVALELPAAERSAYLAAACGDNWQLRKRVEELLQADEAPEGFLPEEHGTAPGETPFAAAGQTAAVTERPGDCIGRYKLLEKLGEGGCGVVYLAEQEVPVRRKVALKVIKLGMDTRSVIARFEAERQALALMDHSNIAKVLDAGATDTGRPYFVMELVSGIKITDYCQQNQLDTRQRLDLFIQVCRAIQHAHQKGVIHRDIKPSNVLVATQDGLPVPKVIDFGIAKATQGKLTDQTVFTALEQFMGTPAYMSPEQADLGAVDIDTRSDIYSLGVLLYELLTGKTPFDAKELLAGGLQVMRRTIQEKEPPTPSTRLAQQLVVGDVSRRNSASGLATTPQTEVSADSRRRLQTTIGLLRGDLDWIVMKCLEKDRARRYETANGLARDIERHLNNEPVIASPPSKLYEFQKTVRRHKFGFGATAVIMLVLAVGATISTWQAVRIASLQRAEAEQRRAATNAAADSRRSLYAADMNLVHQAYAAGDLGLAASLLSTHVPGPGQTDLRGFEWYYFHARCQGDQLHTFRGFADPVSAVTLSPDGTRLAAGSYDHGIRIWTMPGRTLEVSFDGGGAIEDLEFSPDGQWLAYCGEAGPLSFRELRTGHTFRLVERGAVRMSLSPRGTLVAFAKGTDVGGGNIVPSTNNPGVEVWDYSTRKVLFATPEPTRSLRFSMDGKMLGIVGWDHYLRVWRVTDGGLAGTFGPVSIRAPLCFSPDGRRVASGNESGEILVWDLSDGRLVRQARGHDAAIWDVCHVTNLLITASADQTLRVWDAESLSEQAVLRGHSGEVWRFAVSPDATVLASGGKDGSVRIWSLRQPSAALVPARKVNFWSWPVTSEDGLHLAVGEPHGVTIRRTDDGSVVRTLTNAQRPIAFTSAHNELIALGSGGDLQFWNLVAEPRQAAATIDAGLTKVRAHAFSARSGLLALGNRDGYIRLWDLRQRSEIRSWKALEGEITTLAIAPDGLCLASGGAGSEGALRLWSLPTGALKANLVGHELAIYGVAFSPSGRLLASASVDDTCRLWNPTNGKAIVKLGGCKGGAYGVAFSADEKTLFVGTGDRRVKLWNLATLRALGSIEVEPGSVFFAGFVKTPPTLVTVSFDGPRENCSLCLVGAAPAQAAAPGSSSLRKLSP
jgi:WD40 repeat protein/serine/threonine protein kinase